MRDRAEEPQSNPPEETTPEQKAEKKQNMVSIMTDIADSFFRLEGPVSVKGAGIFWEKTGLPAGDYRVSFGAVEGYETPPPQTGTLRDGGALSFVGRYTKMTQVVVSLNTGVGKFKIIRPDGQYLDLKGNSQGLFKDLPTGDYTIIYDDVPGFGTPGPQTRRLGPGGHLQFSGIYTALGDGGPGQGTGSGGGGTGGRGERKRPPRETEVPRLDNRVRMLVTTYFRAQPETGVEGEYGTIPYPERIIRRENYQEGWCQVYLILRTDDRGEVTEVMVERPGRDDWKRFQPLIDAVEKAVRAWRFRAEAAEVHVDVRFFVEK
jgi:hypothetical protein